MNMRITHVLILTDRMNRAVQCTALQGCSRTVVMHQVSRVLDAEYDINELALRG